MSVGCIVISCHFMPISSFKPLFMWGKQLFLILVLLGFKLNAYSEQWPPQLSKEAQITLLTVSPGNELYSAFGHSALRVFDPEQNLDVVFNYGAFDFEPTFGFYWRFFRGRLDYRLDTYTYDLFLRDYAYYNRTVVQQHLQLSQEQKNNIYHFLLENNLPGNRAYRYDFFYDNCSTRIRDVFERELGNDINFYPGNNRFSKTYRDLVHEYTVVRHWIDLGIKLILGHPADTQADGRGYMFLPDYMMLAFDSAVVTVDGKQLPFVRWKETVLEKKAYAWQAKNTGYMQPVFVLWVIFLPLLLVSINDILRKSRTKWLDNIVYSVAGLSGLFFLFCWFGTDHSVLSWNFNILWAFPGHIIMVFSVAKARRKWWVRHYFLASSVLVTLILLNWFWLPQPLHAALAPFLLSLALRGIVIYYHAISYAMFKFSIHKKKLCF